MEEAQRQGWAARHWRIGVAGAWLAVAALLVALKLPDIAALALGDTDDNLRLVQVRDLIAGQGWYDLVQHRLSPPEGANIHWSRLVDLPVAGLILALRPLLGAAAAEQWAAAIAPLLPLGLGFAALALTARRLIAPDAWPLALVVACCAGLLMPMWAPLRIDHHGWQLALLALALAGLVDPRPRRGGATSGIATALSLTIGLEMLVFLALVGAATVLFWVRSRAEAPRIAAYGAALAGGSAAGFLLFASAANRAPVCDALSPVWLSAVAAAGAALVLLAMLPLAGRPARLGAAATAGALLAAGFALAWPGCLAGPYPVDERAARLWLAHVEEAKPIQAMAWRRVLVIAGLPLAGLAGCALALRRTGERRPAWLATAAIAFVAAAMLLWQVRLAPAAQLLAVPGAAALARHLLRKWRASDNMAVRIAGSIAALLIATGLYGVVIATLLPAPAREARADAEALSRACADRGTMAALDALPPGVMLTPVDMAPRLLATTRHAAIAGPYHRNGGAIVDVFKAFRGSPEAARSIAARRHVTHVLLCARTAGADHYGARIEDSLFARLEEGDPPDWLEPVPLPENSPLRLWRVREAPRG